MKHVISLLTAALLLISICGCAADAPEPQTLPIETTASDPSGYVVNGVMEYPNYTFDEDPSIMELRFQAVQAFKDLLSIRWSTATAIKYNKTGPVSDKTFQHEADVTYAGTIYSNANTGIFQFLEFYNFETGRIVYPGEVDEMKETIGASCSDAMVWGLTAVCNSITGPYFPATMVYKNGFIPVGDYTYDFNMQSYTLYPTYKIVEENGSAVILDAYTKVRPGDMFVSTPDNHGMMAIDIPTVIYKEDGSIDLDKSYVNIQDQRGGRGAGFYEENEGGEIIRYSGRTKAKFTFKQLLDKSYLPVTTAEFAGLKPYEKATATSTNPEPKSIDDIRNSTISSNYPLAVVNIIAADEFGNKTVIGRQLFNGGGKDGVPREFALSEMACFETFAESAYNTPSYTIQVEVVPSSGDRIIVSQLYLK